MFELKLNPPQNFAQYRQTEMDQSRVGTFTQVAELPYMSKRFALKRYLGLTRSTRTRSTGTDTRWWSRWIRTSRTGLRLNTIMKLFEFFTHTADGFEQDKTYEPENDISVLDDNDTRKTRLALKDINSLRLASEAHDAQQKEEAVFTQKMYGQPAGTDDLAL